MAAPVRPFGSWPSPVSSASLAGEQVRVDQPDVVDGAVYWLEGRGSEGGRVALVKDGIDVVPAPFNVRSRVHEYGGGAYAVAGDVVLFVNFVDQRLWLVDGSRAPVAITPESEARVRYADLRVDLARGLVLAVREDHRGGAEPANTIVALELAGPNETFGRVLVEGADFVSGPRPSPQGDRLAWLQWHHPNMPWDSTELWVADLDDEGALSRSSRVAGGADIAVTEPRWDSRGRLLYLSDETGWANVYAVAPDASSPSPLLPMKAEFGWPQWVFDRPSFAPLEDGSVVCSWFEVGVGRLGRLGADGSLAALDASGTAYDHVRTDGHTVVALVDRADAPRAVMAFDLDGAATRVLREELDLDLPAGIAAPAEPVTWSNGRGEQVHGIFHAPAHPGFTGPPDELPPLVVRLHGGPTAMTPISFGLDTAYWTSRGFAVLDVNYGGSTGYGRAYRERLLGLWGVVDVDDCATGARALADQGRVDGARLAIRGGSAGGFTTLAALTGTDVFAAGASLYGVGDLEALARDTHKFESRYLDRLVAPYPGGADVYRERSPLHHLDRLSAPMILLQGLDDLVVPPNQAQQMADAVRARGLPVAHLEFEGEGHGFRGADSIVRARDAEAYFYSRVFGFDLADEVAPVRIDNL